MNIKEFKEFFEGWNDKKILVRKSRNIFTVTVLVRGALAELKIDIAQEWVCIGSDNVVRLTGYTMTQNNPVAKHARKFNLATVQADRKKRDKAGYQKHKKLPQE